VAGDDDGDAVAAIGLAHCAGGPRPADRASDRGVATRLPDGDPAELLPDAPLERRPFGREREGELRSLTGEVLPELANDLEAERIADGGLVQGTRGRMGSLRPEPDPP
jgi:hypothetical protein